VDALPRTASFRKIKPRRAFEEICESIRDQLSAGVLRPGDKLPPERELSLQLGVGRNAVREALRSLEFAGIVVLRKGTKGGAFIREGDPGAMTQVLQDLMHLGSISLDELMEARLHIQDAVVRLAAVRASQTDFDALERNIAKTEQATLDNDFLARIECSREFYRILASATHNQALCLIVESLTEILMRYLRASAAAGVRTQPNLTRTRRKFLKLLASRDAEAAAKEMQKHLQSVHRLLTRGANPPAPAEPASRHKLRSDGSGNRLRSG
jgi:GntR family transcriptional repressor for pyruvate dehydrogenase complex